MNRATVEKSEHSSAPPKPVIKKRRWPVVLIWLVPVCAAVMAGYYLYDTLHVRGPEITLTFSDGTGLKAGQSKVMHLGVEVGGITDIGLSPDQKHVLVHVRLQHSQDSFAKKGAIFWVVRPEISMQSISGLGTVLSGPYIDTLPGTGELQTEFTGLDKAPAAPQEGLRIVLKAPRLDHLQSNSPVYFRGMEVGVVEDIQLDPDGNSVDVYAFIQKRYRPLVKTNSQFWVVSAVDVKAGLLSGVQLKVESFRSLLAGGIGFATPEQDMGDQATDGSQYVLHDESKKEWLDWAPKIPIEPDDSDQRNSDANLPQAPQTVRSAVGS
jgi:paraquat-inducible protein B